jgi:hypothetical protein
MRRTLGFAAAALAMAAFVAGCGDGTDTPEATTPPGEPTQQATTSGGSTPPVIDAPKVPDRNIDAIYPEHGARVTQQSTRTPDPDDPQGACVQINFDELPGSFTWFRVAFDDVEVTPNLTVRAATNAQSEGVDAGTLCWAPEEGFTVGVHIVTVAIQNPDNPNEPTRQLMQWQFEVVP